jgi:hypothetical protein
MHLVTRTAGDSRVVRVKPIDITPRANIRPDESGVLHIIDPALIKVRECTLYPEVKEAGHFHFYSRDKGGNYSFFSKRQNVLGTYTDLYPKIRRMSLPELPKASSFAVELIWPEHKDTEVPTAIKNCPEELRIRALGVAVFENVCNIGDLSMGYIRGREILHSVFCREDIVQSFPSVNITSREQAAGILERFLRLAKVKGIEGYVFKQSSYAGWWKLKGTREADVFILKSIISNSETQNGMVTSVEIGCYDDNGEIVPMGSVSGFPMDIKKQMTEAYNGGFWVKKYYRKVLRVQYQEIAGRGKMKHGFFDGWRSDKGPAECMYSQFE